MPKYDVAVIYTVETTDECEAWTKVWEMSPPGTYIEEPIEVGSDAQVTPGGEYVLEN